MSQIQNASQLQAFFNRMFDCIEQNNDPKLQHITSMYFEHFAGWKVNMAFALAVHSRFLEVVLKMMQSRRMLLAKEACEALANIVNTLASGEHNEDYNRRMQLIQKIAKRCFDSILYLMNGDDISVAGSAFRALWNVIHCVGLQFCDVTDKEKLVRIEPLILRAVLQEEASAGISTNSIRPGNGTGANNIASTQPSSNVPPVPPVPRLSIRSRNNACGLLLALVHVKKVAYAPFIIRCIPHLLWLLSSLITGPNITENMDSVNMIISLLASLFAQSKELPIDMATLIKLRSIEFQAQKLFVENNGPEICTTILRQKVHDGSNIFELLSYALFKSPNGQQRFVNAGGIELLLDLAEGSDKNLLPHVSVAAMAVLFQYTNIDKYAQKAKLTANRLEGEITEGNTRSVQLYALPLIGMAATLADVQQLIKDKELIKILSSMLVQKSNSDQHLEKRNVDWSKKMALVLLSAITANSSTRELVDPVALSDTVLAIIDQPQFHILCARILTHLMTGNIGNEELAKTIISNQKNPMVRLCQSFLKCSASDRMIIVAFFGAVCNAYKVEEDRAAMWNMLGKALADQKCEECLRDLYTSLYKIETVK